MNFIGKFKLDLFLFPFNDGIAKMSRYSSIAKRVCLPNPFSFIRSAFIFFLHYKHFCYLLALTFLPHCKKNMLVETDLSSWVAVFSLNSTLPRSHTFSDHTISACQQKVQIDTFARNHNI